MTSVRVPVPWRIAGITTPFVLLIIIIIGEEWNRSPDGRRVRNGKMLFKSCFLTVVGGHPKQYTR